MEGKKIAAMAVSIILVVGVCIGLIVGIGRSSHNNSSSDNGMSTSAKTVASICAPTDYKEACVSSLNAVANNESATPKDFIQTAIQVTIQEVKAALENSGTIGKAANDSSQKMAVEDCQDLLQFAVEELQASFSMVGEAELKNWLSAVISYQQTCLDGVTQPELKSAMSNGLLNATQLTSNALAIVSEISGILDTFKIPLNMSPTSRRLLDASNVDNDGFPAWFSVADRKLLAYHGKNGKIEPNAIVAKDDTGHYKTIAAALAAYPKNHRGRYVIYVKAGVYNEHILVTKDQVNVFMYGDGPRKTMVTGRKSNRDGISTFQTATFSAVGNRFIAKSMGFQNTAGPEGHQAVALRVQSDIMDGFQDTLYAQTHRQFYRNCVISGTVDFIFGDSAAIIQNSRIIVRKPMDNQQNTVTAQGRTDKRETTGLVIQNCRIVPEQKLYPVRFKIPSYLGRPWKTYSRTVIMESTMGDFIQPAGWLPWSGNFALDTL
ncbi:hypothetical protein L1049_016915 [Liquidambar formosana]|uniref:Pectinesterase n=1 Tax=Liquidambar formosana TaxID=63359 RepID=A0AAP0X744_LIQFO